MLPKFGFYCVKEINNNFYSTLAKLSQIVRYENGEIYRLPEEIRDKALNKLGYTKSAFILIIRFIHQCQRIELFCDSVILPQLVSGLNFMTDMIISSKIDQFKVENWDKFQNLFLGIADLVSIAYIEMSKNERFTFQVIHDSFYNIKNLNQLKLDRDNVKYKYIYINIKKKLNSMIKNCKDQ
jgi:hypothetical protein